MPLFQFNAQMFEPQYGASLPQFPVGKKLKVIITGSELKETAKKDGGYLQLVMKCCEGPFAGKEGFDNLNLSNPNPQTVAIAQKQLSAYCHVLGVFMVNQTEQLHNIPFLIDVDWQKGNEPTQAKPEGGYTQIVAIYDLQGNKPGQGGKAAQGQQAPVAPPPPTQPPQGQPGGWNGQPQQPQQPPAPVAPSNANP